MKQGKALYTEVGQVGNSYMKADVYCPKCNAHQKEGKVLKEEGWNSITVTMKCK